MADDEVINPLGSPTTNYGWTKPAVGGDVDAWGDMLNADLDGIDSVVHGIDTRPGYTLPTASTTVLGGVKVDGSTIMIAGGTISTATSVSNYTTWNPADLLNITLSGGNLVATTTNNGAVRTVVGLTSGKVYWEATATLWVQSSTCIGLGLVSVSLSNFWQAPANCIMMNKGGQIWNNGSIGPSIGGTLATGVVICFALDVTNHLLWMRNGAAGNWNGSGTANPATGTGGISISGWATTALYAMAGGIGGSDVWTANFGASAFSGAAPSGFISPYLPLTGGTLTGNLAIATPGAGTHTNLTLNKNASGENAQIFAQTNGSTRWIMRLGNFNAESGNNVGSDFDLLAYNDTGNPIVNALSIARATGVVTIPNLSAPQAIGDNRIINGDMRIDQRNNGASGTASGVTRLIDGSIVRTQAGKGTWQRNLGHCYSWADWVSVLLWFHIIIGLCVAGGGYVLFRPAYRSRHDQRFCVGNGKRAAGHVVVLGLFQPDRHIQRRNRQLDRLRDLIRSPFRSRREHLDEDRHHHSRRHGWNMGDERQCAGALCTL